MTDMHKVNQHDSWDNRELGATEEFVDKVSPAREKIIDDKLNLQIISIRLQKDLIDELKELAAEDGLGYQPYLRQVLTQHVRNEKRIRKKHLREIRR